MSESFDEAGETTRLIHLFDFQAIVEIRAISQFRHAGVSLQEIRRVISHMREESAEAWKQAWLVTDGRRIFQADGSEALRELGSGDGQMAFAAIAMESIRDDVEDRIKDRRPYVHRGLSTVRSFEAPGKPSTRTSAAAEV